MLGRTGACAGLLLLAGCAYDAGYHRSNYASQPESTAGYYNPIDYSTPYLPSSPVYRSPYRGGPVLGGIYVSGEDRDTYGGPIFSPFQGIRCDRRRHFCWNRSGVDAGWTSRFFGYGYSPWAHGSWNQPNPGGSNPNANQPAVYQVPENPDGSGTPTFYAGCGAVGQPPC